MCKFQLMTPKTVAKIRKRLAMTQGQFAKLIGVTETTVWRWENGYCRPIPVLERALRDIGKQAKGAA